MAAHKHTVGMYCLSVMQQQNTVQDRSTSQECTEVLCSKVENFVSKRRLGYLICHTMVLLLLLLHHRHRCRYLHHHHWKNGPFWTIIFLRRFCQTYLFRHELDHLVFISSDFVTVFFYASRSLALHPTPNLEDQVPVFMSPSERLAQLYPQAVGSVFVAFCTVEIF
jgi:hypothetical protein